MIDSKDIERLFMVSPFGGVGHEAFQSLMSGEDVEFDFESEFDSLNDAGIDMEEIMEWAMEKIRPLCWTIFPVAGPDFGVAAWLSGLRAGFYLGRGYTEDNDSTESE